MNSINKVGYGRYALTEPISALQELYKKKIFENILANTEISNQLAMTLQGNPNKRSSVHIAEMACKIASQNIIRQSLELRKKQKKLTFQKYTA